MRLIDADAIIIDLLDRGIEGVQTDDYAEFQQIVEDAPTVDAVLVVRCRECGAFRPLKEVGGICWNTGYYVPEDGFCHDGERKGRDE
jgi:hypothetical protein